MPDFRSRRGQRLATVLAAQLCGLFSLTDALQEVEGTAGGGSADEQQRTPDSSPSIACFQISPGGIDKAFRNGARITKVPTAGSTGNPCAERHGKGDGCRRRRTKPVSVR